MQFLATKLSASVLAVVMAGAALVLSVTASPVANENENSESELLTWLSTTDANLTFIGAEPGSAGSRAGGNVNVVFCSSRSGSVCGGACTVYNGGATCLAAPDTQCLMASANVAFCDHTGCSGSCNVFNSCGTKLDNGFCATPGTKSINVPFV